MHDGHGSTSNALLLALGPESSMVLAKHGIAEQRAATNGPPTVPQPWKPPQQSLMTSIFSRPVVHANPSNTISLLLLIYIREIS